MMKWKEKAVTSDKETEVISHRTPENNLSSMAKKKQQKLIFQIVGGVAIAYFCMQLGTSLAIQVQGGKTFADALLYAMNYALQFELPHFSIVGTLIAILGTLLYVVAIIYSGSSKKNYRPNVEHGSAKKGDILTEASLLSAEHNENKEKRSFQNNIILSKNIHLDMDTWHTKLNNNIFVVGGSGSGKTRYFVKPNCLQLENNYIIIDPKGSVAEEVGHAFQTAGYEIRYLNLVDMDRSMGYNPFEYFQNPVDVQNFVRNLVDNTSDSNQTGGDEFFVKSEITWLTAIIFYIMATCEGTELCNMNTVMLLLDLSKASEEDENKRSQVDILFDELEEENRERNDGRGEYSYADLACRNYRIYKMAAGKTAKSILISVGVRLSIFNLPSLQRILQKDELHLEHFGQPMVCSETSPHDLSKDVDPAVYETLKNGSYEDLPRERLRKSVLFVIISDNVKTFTFLSSIILEQMYTILYRAADQRKDYKLPIHTRFINDEFANCGKQPDFNRKISTMRSREISTAVIVQGISQIKSKSLYGDEWETIFENCDTTLFLGSKGSTTLTEMQKLAGKETVALKVNTVTKGTSSSYSTAEQYVQRDLYDYAELGKLPNDRCLVHFKGYDIFEDDKFDVKLHPNVNLTMDTNDPSQKMANRFDVAQYIAEAQRIDALRVESTKDEIRKQEIHGLNILDAFEEGDFFGNFSLQSSNNIFINYETLEEENKNLDNFTWNDESDFPQI